MQYAFKVTLTPFGLSPKSTFFVFDEVRFKVNKTIRRGAKFFRTTWMNVLLSRARMNVGVWKHVLAALYFVFHSVNVYDMWIHSILTRKQI